MKKKRKSTAEKSSAVGNAAKLREALGKLRAELWNNTVIAGKRKFELYEIADAALAAPATAEKSSAVGDAAKLREALEFCVKGMCGFCRMDAEARGMTTKCVHGCEALRKAKAALAAPPRNCDVPKVMEDPWRAWLDDESNWEDGNPKLEIHDWLFAPATEKEGRAK